jgi:G3E family GTPase
MLRVKGIVNVEGKPVVVQGVQHIFHPPTLLPAWPDADRRSRLVFITRDIGRVAIADSYAAMVGPLEADSTPA